MPPSSLPRRLARSLACSSEPPSAPIYSCPPLSLDSFSRQVSFFSFLRQGVDVVGVVFFFGWLCISCASGSLTVSFCMCCVLVCDSSLWFLSPLFFFSDARMNAVGGWLGGLVCIDLFLSQFPSFWLPPLFIVFVFVFLAVCLVVFFPCPHVVSFPFIFCQHLSLSL